jgi:Amt family ammonium transporter
MIFQAMFAVITPALLMGAIAERMKFKAFFFFTLLWSTLVYDPIAHWVWGAGGWIRQMGALDFAGGIVVHISSGVSALAAALLMGKRKGYGTESMAPHSLPMTIAGAGILWFGWFGFNAGSAIAAGMLSTSAFVVTHIAGAAGALSWAVVEWIYKGKPNTLGAASGAVAGLATITPASGFVTPLAALFIGLTAGVFCYVGVFAKNKFGYDDSLDVVGIHGVGGTWGALAIGLFATKAVNDAGNNGLFFGNVDLLGVQALAVLVTWAYSFGVTFILLKILDWTIGLRLSEEDEDSGLDLSQHSETGYNF